MSTAVPPPSPVVDAVPAIVAAAPIAAPIAAPAAGQSPRIPALVWRNTVLLASSQAIVGAGTQMIPSLGALMVQQLSGSANLAGLASSLLGVSRFLVAYPVGRLTDRYGRVAGIMAGQAVSLFGAIMLGASVVMASFPLLVLGLLVFGLGVGAGQQLRLAAADMFVPARRAEGLGYVMTGSLLGALGGPLLVRMAEAASGRFDVPAVAATWWLVPLLILPSMVLVAQVRPDPREIANNLSRYYPGYVAPVSQAQPAAGPTGLGPWLRFGPTRTAFVAAASAQGAMALMMAMTPLSLSHHGHTLEAISLSVALHVVGMFGFSLPVGRLSDRIGRRATMLLGTGVCAAGALLVPVSPDYWVATLGIFLVGVGWSGVTVASTALIAGVVPPQSRGRAVGAGDTLAGIASITCPLIAGPAVTAFGLGALAPLTLAVLAPAVVLLLRSVEPGRLPEL